MHNTDGDMLVDNSSCSGCGTMKHHVISLFSWQAPGAEPKVKCLLAEGETLARKTLWLLVWRCLDLQGTMLEALTTWRSRAELDHNFSSQLSSHLVMVTKLKSI